MAQLPPGYVGQTAMIMLGPPPQPPALQPPPPNPHLLRPPVQKTSGPVKIADFIQKPVLQIYHSIFG